jgi:SPX domain protein involved in polyphosphate accumulation
VARREYKYLIDERTVDRVRRDLEGICVPDEHAAQGRYLCDTLYLDTLALDLYRATVENARVRQKVRVRSYPHAAGAPVFLEVKRRVDDVIVKTRAAVPATEWVSILETGDLDRVPPDQRRDAEPFFAAYHGSRRGPLVPELVVRYEREPYTSTLDDYVRVTFDRKIQARSATELPFDHSDHGWSSVDHPLAMRASSLGSFVVLELKFTDRAPAWMRQLVARHELPRLSFSKYARGIESLNLAPQLRAARLG